MRWRRYMAGAICVALASCGVETQLKKRTLVGVSAQQTLIDAQHALAEEGLDIEEIDFQQGMIKSSWQTKNRRQIQYVVQVSTPDMEKAGPAPIQVGADAGVPPVATDTSGDTAPGVVDIRVTTQVKEKTVGGWTSPKPSRSARAERLLDDIIELSIRRFPGAPEDVPPPPPADETPSCLSSTECPAGMHCGSGKCVKECEVKSDCGTRSVCDERGRCVPRVEPCPEPLPVTETAVDSEEKTAKSSSSARKGGNDDK